ncbi:hypothetical protein QJS10_CPA03g00918 [Acorus calamus]|uniref:Uncharacterized protein n=1 Tax=Acorus calamus TaxID=4465 RepID=A0AAV9F455_ACOCL|nr:hypothetical protein QJS10_CPA03g00918 [Acorus calamus]
MSLLVPPKAAHLLLCDRLLLLRSEPRVHDGMIKYRLQDIMKFVLGVENRSNGASDVSNLSSSSTVNNENKRKRGVNSSITWSINSVLPRDDRQNWNKYGEKEFNGATINVPTKKPARPRNKCNN